MKFQNTALGQVKIVPVCSDKETNEGKELLAYLKEEDLFQGQAGKVYADLGPKGDKVIFVGLGEEGKVTFESLRKSFYGLGKTLADYKIKEATVMVEKIGDLCRTKTMTAMATGLANSAYVWDKYVSEKKEKPEVTIGFAGLEDKGEDAAKALEEISKIQEGVNLARDLVNEPAEVLYPETLANRAKEALEPLGVQVEILDKKAIEDLGMTAFLAVARGSAREPKLIVMRYQGQGEGHGTIGLVGKGLTYDSGGYAIKPAASMADMHTDMGGSGAVIGAMAAIAANKLPKNVTAVVAACENMISGEAYKNGDIIRAMNGKTIEIGNTDAEGRLTLADAITYIVTKEKVDCLVDLATLTGAVIVALGSFYTGAVTNDDELMAQFKVASETAGEKVWQLPLDDCYRDMVKGKRADLLNSVKGGAGSITAGAFLENFTEGTKWLHLDIAGTAYSDSQKSDLPVYATGTPVKSLYHFVKGEA